MYDLVPLRCSFSDYDIRVQDPDRDKQSAHKLFFALGGMIQKRRTPLDYCNVYHKELQREKKSTIKTNKDNNDDDHY